MKSLLLDVFLLFVVMLAGMASYNLGLETGEKRSKIEDFAVLQQRCKQLAEVEAFTDLVIEEIAKESKGE